jgi:hypothetical protein
MRAAEDGVAAVSSGEAEFASLARDPADEQRAVGLAEVLVARADVDNEFREALANWWERASQVQVSGNVANTVSGGTQYGPVLQGRDFTGLTFGSPATRAAQPPDGSVLPATG